MKDPLIRLGCELAGVAALVGDIEGDEPVPACPGWPAADLYVALWGRLPASAVAPTGAAVAWLHGPRVP